MSRSRELARRIDETSAEIAELATGVEDTCDDRNVFDADVDCRIEAIVSDDPDGGETTTYWLVSGEGFELQEALRFVLLGESRSATRITHLVWRSSARRDAALPRARVRGSATLRAEGSSVVFATNRDE